MCDGGNIQAMIGAAIEVVIADLLFTVLFLTYLSTKSADDEYVGKLYAKSG